MKQDPYHCWYNTDCMLEKVCSPFVLKIIVSNLMTTAQCNQVSYRCKYALYWYGIYVNDNDGVVDCDSCPCC